MIQLLNSRLASVPATQEALNELRRFMSKSQFITLACQIKNSKNSEYFQNKVLDLVARIHAMPVTMSGDHRARYGSETAYLRYHMGPMAFYVTRKAPLALGQVFGWIVNDQRPPEAGFIEIANLTFFDEITLDLAYVPISVNAALEVEGEFA